MKLKSDSSLTHDPADNKLKNAVINQCSEHLLNFSHEYACYDVLRVVYWTP